MEEKFSRNFTMLIVENCLLWSCLYLKGFDCSDNNVAYSPTNKPMSLAQSQQALTPCSFLFLAPSDCEAFAVVSLILKSPFSHGKNCESILLCDTIESISHEPYAQTTQVKACRSSGDSFVGAVLPFQPVFQIPCVSTTVERIQGFLIILTISQLTSRLTMHPGQRLAR